MINPIDDLISISGADDVTPENARRFKAILNLAKEIDDPKFEGVDAVKVSLTDDGANDCEQIDAAVAALAKLQSEGKRTLVHCRSGVSRAPSIVAAYFARHQGWTLDSAIDAIRAKRSIVGPKMALWQTVLMCSVGSQTY